MGGRKKERERGGGHLQGSLGKNEQVKEKQDESMNERKRRRRQRCGLISKKPMEKD